MQNNVKDIIVEKFKSLPTACVSDAMDKLGILGSAFGIVPLTDELTLVGRAFTVRYVPVGAGGGTVGDFIDDVPLGGVVVISNNGRTDCTVWGDIMTTTAIAKGIAGTVIDGVCRDVSYAISNSYPLYTCGRFMRTGKDRVTVAEVGGTVNLSDAQVSPGDIIVGNADGIVVVPQNRAEEIYELASSIEHIEEKIIIDIKNGISLFDARKKHSYHNLQKRSK